MEPKIVQVSEDNKFQLTNPKDKEESHLKRNQQKGRFKTEAKTDWEILTTYALKIWFNVYPSLPLQQVLKLRICSKELKNFATTYLTAIFNRYVKLGIDHNYLKRFRQVFGSYSEFVYTLNLEDVKSFNAKELKNSLKVFDRLHYLNLPAEFDPKVLQNLKLLKNLKILRCENDNDKINNLNLFPFQELTHLQSLFLNHFFEIKKGWDQLAHLTHLKYLSLPIVPYEVSLGFLQNLTSLKSLDLCKYWDGIDHSCFTVLTCLKNLTYLNLQVNHLERLKRYLEKLPHLKKLEPNLDLELCPRFYAKITSLTELDLNNQSITEEMILSITGLSHLTKFKVLNAQSQTEIYYLRSLNQLLSLKEIDLSTNGEYQVREPLFYQLTHLTKVKLSWIKLKDHHLERFNELKQLEFLDLSHNQEISDLSFITSLVKLKSLNLRNCINIPKGQFLKLSHLTGLHFLSLSGSRVKNHVSKVIRLLSSLKALRLAETKVDLTQLLKIAHLTGLKVLDVSHTYFHRHKLTFLRGLIHLEELKMARMQSRDKNIYFGNVEVAYLSALTKLKILDLSDLGDFSDSSLPLLSRLTLLQQLSLKDIPFTNQGLQALTVFTRLEQLALSSEFIHGQEAIQPLANLKHLTLLHIKGKGIKKKQIKSLVKWRHGKIHILE